MKKCFVKPFAFGLAAMLAVVPLITDIGSPLALAANAREMTDQEIERERGSATASSSSASSKSSVYPHASIKSWIAKYSADNKDVKGYLIIPNTNIAKPVAFSSKDNNYYAYRDIKGTNYPNTTYQNFKETATYLDYRTKFASSWTQSSRNTVVYGHNWTNLRDPLAIGANNNHIMFGQLPSYTNIDFAKANPHIYFSTDKNEGIWRVFCVAYVEVSSKFNYNAPNPTQEQYSTLLAEFKKRSMFDFDVDLKSSDRIITLSTCTRQYNVGSQQRFVVVARLLRDGESENDKVAVSVNKDMKKPAF